MDEDEREEILSTKSKVLSALLLLTVLSLAQSFTVYSTKLYTITAKKDDGQGEKDVDLYNGGLFSTCNITYFQDPRDALKSDAGNHADKFYCPDSPKMKAARAFYVIGNVAGFLMLIWWTVSIASLHCGFLAKYKKEKLSIIFALIYFVFLAIASMCLTVTIIDASLKVNWAFFAAWAASAEAFIAVIASIALPSLQIEDDDKKWAEMADDNTPQESERPQTNHTSIGL
ncbi:uncharacterized protein LOC142344047 [Convolutriloba macropyga]|uniref:uncharacterized protein LOC142344047 n=1 Tax=Convolutriloba macropyga TaxID=536237 RepID=UPI003F5269E1